MHDQDFLTDALILLIAAVIAVPLAQRLRLGPILGYLAAGIAIGPSVLGLIGPGPEMRALAELGVVFLLFAIGLELRFSRLWVMRRFVFGLGSAQIVLTAGILAAAGVLLGLPTDTALVAGVGLALSSTAVVLQILTDRSELASRHGRIAFSVLLMQDLAVAPALVLIGAFGEAEASHTLTAGRAALEAVAAVAAIFVAGRYLLRPLLKTIAAARTSEIFAAAAVLLVLGVGWLSDRVGLSMGLGAFLAGLFLAETEFRHQVEADVQPFRGFLLGLFFITVGMQVDLTLLLRQPLAILGTVFALMLLKAVLLYLLGRLWGQKRRISAAVGIMLSQGGEFAFILFGLAAAQGLMTPQQNGELVLAVSLTMLVSPLLVQVAAQIASKVKNADSDGAMPAAERRAHVIIAGFGRVGRTVGAMLEHQGIPYVALDSHADRVAEAVAQGLPVFYADASRPSVLHAAGAGSARAVIVTLDHPGRAERTVAALRHAFPQLPIYARARDFEHSKLLIEAGATTAQPETLESSLQLGALVLRAVGEKKEQVDLLVGDLRAADYSRLADLIAGKGKPKAEATPDRPPPTL